MRTLNILFIIYDLERGGPEMRLLNFAKYFPGHLKIRICVTSENLSLLGEFKRYNVPIEIVPISRPYFEIGKIKQISDYCRANRIDVVNTFDLKGVIIAAFMKLFWRTTVQCVYHNVNSLLNYTTLQRNILKFMLKFSDVVLCNSFFSEKEFLTYAPRSQTKVIYNGVDIAHFQYNPGKRTEIRSKRGIEPDEIVLGIVANFRTQKNHHFLIDAFARLAAENQHLKLICVGGGLKLQEIKTVVSQKSIADRVIFTGYTEDVVGYLNSIDILVLTSTWEGMPNVLIEAMCMGIPVISSDVGGCPEIIKHNLDGLLFRANDIGDFIAAVKLLISNREMKAQLREQATKKIIKKFSHSRMIENYACFFENLCKEVN